MTELEKYKTALDIACELLNGSVFYGYDSDKIFEEVMEKQGCFGASDYKEVILDNLDFFLHGEGDIIIREENKT